jgi:hypothetical protein
VLGNVRYEVREVSDDPDTQVAEVIDMMRQYATEDSRSVTLRDDLERALHRHAGDRASDTQKCAAIFRHVKGRIRFTKDNEITAWLQPQVGEVPIVEALIRPIDMALMCEDGTCSRIGDCDDHAMYCASLLCAAGIPCSYVTVAANSQTPGQYSHVYVAAYPQDGSADRVALDASHGAYPGWEVEAGRITRMKEWVVEGPCGVSAGGLLVLGVMALAAVVLLRTVWR